MKYLVLVSILTLIGCGTTTLSNEDIVKQVKICREAGMKAEVLHNFNNEPVRVECIP